MWSISRLVKVLVSVVLCAISVTAWAEAPKRTLIAKVGSYEITQFEVNSFINKVLPIGTFHKSSINKQEYHSKAVKESIDASLLLIHIQQHKPELYNDLEKQAKTDIETIQTKAKTADEFDRILAQNGISESDLINTRMKLAVKDLYEKTFMSKTPEDTVLQAYYDNNPSMFMTGASADVQTCLIKADARNLSVEEMKKKFADAQIIAFKLKEGGESFDDQSCDTGLYPKQHRIYRFSKGYPAKQILKMAEGDISAPLKNIYGFLIVKIDKMYASEQLPYAEVKDQIDSIMKRKAFQKDYQQILKDMKDEVVVHMFDRHYSG